jgi:hypothetical protein
MKLTSALSIAVAAAVSASSPVARAQDDSAPFANPPPPNPAPMAAVASSFGAAGQWVASMRTGPGSGYAYFHKSGGNWELSIHPAIDYFITSRISIGGVFGYTHSPAQMGTNILDFGARAGINLDIAGSFSFWPTAGIAGRVHSAERVTDTSTALQIFAPFLWHPVAHAFIGLGPEFQVGLSGGDYTEYGIDFIIGGWL